MKWWLFPAFGIVACAVYLSMPAGTPSNTLFVAVSVASVAAVVVGVAVNRPASMSGWILIAIGSGLWALGDATAFALATADSPPAITIVDIIYLAGYPVLASGLYLLVHRGWRRGQLGHVANSAIVMIAFGLLLWVFVVRPDSVDVSTAEGVLAVAYPAMDVYLLGLLVHFVGAPQWRSASYRLLTVAVLVVLAADLAAEATSTSFVGIGTGVTDAGYLAFYLLVGTAALHPSVCTLASPKPRRGPADTAAASFSFPTVVVVTAATLTAPAAMAILLIRGEPVAEWGWGVVACATVLVVLVFIRVSELLLLLARQTRALRSVAETDQLTGLSNRIGVEKWMSHDSRRDTPLAFLIIDVDRFHEINDTFGHGIGDDVLRAVAIRLGASIGRVGVIGRVGADEFAVVLHAERSDAVSVAGRLHASLNQPVTVGPATLLVEVSIGIALSANRTRSDASATTEGLAKQAYRATQYAKTVQPRIAVYDSSMDRDNSAQLSLLSELGNAIEQRHLAIYYQVQVDLSTMRAIGVEALLRWNHPERGLVEPAAFLPVAERTGLIRPLLDYVLTEVATQRHAWSEDGIDLTVSVNISTRNLLDTTLVEQVARVLDTSHLDPSTLAIEITETSSMTDPPGAIETLNQLRDLGVTLVIDDYGTGYSSLAYLQTLPVQQLKIDKVFVADMTSVVAHQVIVRSTIDLARTLGLTVVAEGVEDEQTLLALKELRCDHAQGFHLGRPVPAADIPAVVAALEQRIGGEVQTS
ncbi:putative bifunctional diguanylate cyclase/phosphodiesterase [Rhodococcoides fascians]|uniref:putative bifunctional diguanylate cyclase/phosphodiesterase n=1 Tax=Rhodococcoides fascians TaxID=1828 RepID=UPI000566595B|nr:bifunctional diguanylate cyclase/phosphodiesterase [Rhodococcus fascians]